MATLDRAAKHTIGLSMVFVDGPANDVVQVSVDRHVVHTGTSWEDCFRDVEGNPTRTVDSLLFCEGSNNPAADVRPGLAGHGFLVDDVVLTSGPGRLPLHRRRQHRDPAGRLLHRPHDLPAGRLHARR